VKTPTFVIYILVQFFCESFLAQTSTDALIKKLYTLWDMHYHYYSIDHIQGKKEDAFSLFQQSDTISDGQNLINYNYELKMAESAILEKDWGLSWNSNFLLNTAPGMDEVDNIFYRSRVLSEIKWDVIKSGYLQNKTLAQIKQNEAIIAQLETFNKTKKNNLFYTWHSIIYQFNLYKIQLVNLRLELSKSRVETAYQLYENGMITQEEMLKNIESYAEIKSLLKIYQDYNNQLTSTFSKRNDIAALPLIDINYTYTLTKLQHSKNDSVNALLLKNIELEQKNINTINLGFFSRYNYYDIPTASNDRSFLTIGFNLGVPIVFDKKEQANYYQLKAQQLQNDVPAEQEQMQKDVLTYFYEFRYKLKQFNTFYYKSLLLKELLRKEQARHEIDPLAFNPLKALRTLDELMSVDIELIDLKQQMYLYLLRIYMAVPESKMEEMIQPLSLDALEINEGKKGADEIYIWSKILKEQTPNFLAEYCIKKGFKKVVLSIGGEKELLEQSISEFAKSSLQVDLMIGNNDLINGSIENYLISKVGPYLSSKISGIHLDVEPHTISDWDTNKEAYLVKYVTMVNEAKKFCDQHKLTLSVSVPLNYPKETLDQVYATVDVVYFMCYENVKTDYIIRKISGYEESKTIIALRIEDFNTANELYAKIDELANLVSVKGYIIHDLGRLIKLND
jgi:hypothetical protein